MAACRPWLEAEIRIVKPNVLICLGSTAAQAIIGKTARVTRDRGKVQPTAFAPVTSMTFHPSALLRAPDEATRDRQFAEFVADLRQAARAAKID